MEVDSNGCNGDRLGHLRVRSRGGRQEVQLNGHVTGSAVLLPLEEGVARHPGDITLRKAEPGAGNSHVNLGDLHIIDQAPFTQPGQLQRFEHEGLQKLYVAACHGFARKCTCSLLRSPNGEGSGCSVYSLPLGWLPQGCLVTPVCSLQLLQPPASCPRLQDLQTLLFLPQDSWVVVRQYDSCQRLSRDLDDWKFHNLLDPLMKAAVPFEQIQYRDPAEHLRLF